MFLNNNQFSKKKETFVLFSLILISVLIRIPVILIFGDTSLEHEWKILVNNLINHETLSYMSFDGFLLPNLWMPPLYAYYLYFLIVDNYLNTFCSEINCIVIMINLKYIKNQKFSEIKLKNLKIV